MDRQDEYTKVRDDVQQLKIWIRLGPYQNGKIDRVGVSGERPHPSFELSAMGRKTTGKW